MKKVNGGALIVLEGMDGCGKSTQAELVKEYFTSEGYNVTVTREPGGIKSAEEIRNVILYNEDLDNMTEMMLFMAARRINMQQIILPAMRNGNIVICDRFIDSTLVYQGIVGSVSFDTIMPMNNLATDNHNPDMSIIINLPAKKAYDRVHSNSDRNENNKYDDKEYSFFEKIATAYKELKLRCGWMTDHLYKRVYVDGDQDKDAVCKLIVEKIKLVLDRKNISEE